MASSSPSGNISWATVAGRKVKLYIVDHNDGIQSVNICTPANDNGVYEEVFYYSKAFWQDAVELERFGNVPTMVTHLREQSYQQVRKI